MVQKPLRPGGDTGMRREGVIRGYGSYGFPRLRCANFVLPSSDRTHRVYS